RHYLSAALTPHDTTAAQLAFVFYCSADHRDLHSFPTRRSSDLTRPSARPTRGPCLRPTASGWRFSRTSCEATSSFMPTRTAPMRSEEHTSELQSRENLVCRLLLEKKKHSSTNDISDHKRLEDGG